MNISIKQLKEGQNVIFPQTSAEAVLIKSNQKVVTLDKYIDKKIDVLINGTLYSTITGCENQQIKFGDDFKVDEDNNCIKLTWNGIT